MTEAVRRRDGGISIAIQRCTRVKEKETLDPAERNLGPRIVRVIQTAASSDGTDCESTIKRKRDTKVIYKMPLSRKASGRVVSILSSKGEERTHSAK